MITARVKEFTTVPNHFSDNDDEVIIYEAVSVEGHDLAIEEVWSSHSATLKKLELNTGDKVSFEAKIVAKKLSQHPVKYKVNNPSKMKKSIRLCLLRIYSDPISELVGMLNCNYH